MRLEIVRLKSEMRSFFDNFERFSADSSHSCKLFLNEQDEKINFNVVAVATEF